METKGIKGTWFVNPASVGGDGLVTLAQLQEMYAAGWDIANHSYAHTRLPDYPLETQQSHIQTAIDWLIANDMPRSAYHFAYPYGDYNDDTITAMQNVGILTARNTNLGFWWHSSADYGDKYRLPVGHSFTMSDDEAAYKQAFLNQVQGMTDRGSTMFTMLHIVKETPSTALETSRAFFRFAIDTLVAKRIRIITISEWYNGLVNPRYRSLPVTRATV
jgi:peptidoglycan/xylan/chitin deacetylase (PgdA/CDA1 family)